MITLAIDTASLNCAVALMQDGRVVARVSEKIGKGHAEKLIGQIIEACSLAKIELSSIDRIAVNIGPGSFTGVRIGVATARGLALALVKPAIGVSSLEAIGFEAHGHFPKSHIIALIDAGRDMVYRQDFDENLQPLAPATVQNCEEVVAGLDEKAILAGPFSRAIAHLAGFKESSVYFLDAPDVASFAKLSQNKLPDGSPKPLYLREADAKPQMSFSVPRKKE